MHCGRRPTKAGGRKGILLTVNSAESAVGRGCQMQLAASGSRTWGPEEGRGEACWSPLVRPHLQTRLRSERGAQKQGRELEEPWLYLEKGSCVGI